MFLTPKARVIQQDPVIHISLANFLWDIDKQNSPRCDAAERGVASEAILFASKRNFIIHI